jgi:hypothetical protein
VKKHEHTIEHDRFNPGTWRILRDDIAIFASGLTEREARAVYDALESLPPELSPLGERWREFLARFHVPRPLECALQVNGAA